MRRVVCVVCAMCVLASCTRAVKEQPAPVVAPRTAQGSPVLFEDEEALKAAALRAAWGGGEPVERLLQASFDAEQLKARCPGMAVEGMVSPALARRVYAGLCGPRLRSEDEALVEPSYQGSDMVSELVEVACECPGARRFKLRVGWSFDMSVECPEQPASCEDYECAEGEACDPACEPCSEYGGSLYLVASLDVLKVEGGWGVLLVDEAMGEARLASLRALTYNEQGATPWCGLEPLWETEEE